MPENKPKSNENLHWFWKLTTKWWFFPVFYIALVFIFLAIKGKLIEGDDTIFNISMLLYLMPNGLFYFLGLDIGSGSFLPPRIRYFPPLFHTLFIFSIIIIQYFKLKKNKILKWLIILLILLLLLSFFGCWQQQ